MPGPLYHVGAVGMCMHGGQISTMSANTRVLVSGQPVAVVSDMSTVAACPFNIPAIPKPQPCLTVRWLVPATRVLVGGQPALLQTSAGLCLSAEQIPQGAPSITVNQTRVIAT